MPVSFKKHLIYWIVPSLITLACILIFYFNWLGLSEFIAPSVNREFGVIENIQHLLLILIFFVALKGYRIRNTKIEKYGYALIMAATVFMFLEEIDYGLHYYDHLTSKSEITKVVVFDNEVRNLHNNGKLILNVMKLAAYIVVALFFAALPLLPEKIKEKNRWLNFLSPSRYIIGTAVSLLVLNQIARYLYKNYDYANHSLDANVSEFEEIMTYYIIFLYLRELIKKPKDILYPGLNKKLATNKEKELS
jgi:hypothetical protein